MPMVNPAEFPWSLAVARVFKVPLYLLGVLPRPSGRPRSAHRHRNRGRA